ncbi:MAG TPA: branched-chain amino acid ABC transporter permease [Burkholderiaceae bacterium]|nr:branched-chain amino acid ABC transporter permease [Burkholderiaceae bacterium]
MALISISMKKVVVVESAFWLAIAACPFLFPDRLSLLSQILIFGLFAVSLDIALGYAGILTVGHAAFFGTGAYVAGLLARYGWGEPLSGLCIAFLVSFVLGWLLSFLIVRGADLTRLMITIAVTMLLTETASQLSSITGGSDGLQGIEMWPLLGRFDFDLSGRTGFVYSLSIVLGIFLVVRRILGSPFGLALQGIHDSPRRMRAIGSPVDSRLRAAYTLSGGIAGVAGALLAQTTQFAGIGTLSFDRSAEVLIILVLGGTGRLYGGLIGALVYMLVHELFSDLDPQYWMFWLGAFLVTVVMIGRGGLMGWASRFAKAVRT